MSEAVLRARNQNIPAMISHKEILVPRQPSEAEIRTDYIDLVLDIKSLHKIPGACKEQKVRVSVAENIAHKRDERGWLWMAAIVITAMVPSRIVLEFADASPGDMMVSDQAARSRS